MVESRLIEHASHSGDEDLSDISRLSKAIASLGTPHSFHVGSAGSITAVLRSVTNWPRRCWVVIIRAVGRVKSLRIAFFRYSGVRGDRRQRWLRHFFAAEAGQTAGWKQGNWIRYLGSHTQTTRDIFPTTIPLASRSVAA